MERLHRQINYYPKFTDFLSVDIKKKDIILVTKIFQRHMTYKIAKKLSYFSQSIFPRSFSSCKTK